MSDDEPYEQEFDSDSEPDYFAPQEKKSASTLERVPAKPPQRVLEEAPGEDDDYDEDFEEKSSDLPPKPLKPAAQQETDSEGEEAADFFVTGVRRNSKDDSPGRKPATTEQRSNVQSSGKLTSVSHFDSPEKAFKYLNFLKKENISLRSELKQINDRLNEILDQKISESKSYAEPRKVMQPEQRERATNTQLETAQKQLQMIKKEKIQLYKRLQQVESAEYVEELKAAVEKKERVLMRLQKAQKNKHKTQQTREKDIEKELVRSEMSLNTRVLQELQMENEGLRMKIKDLEREDERNASVASELESQQEKLEQRYVKLMTFAKQNGAFEESSREGRKMQKLKHFYEEQKSALAAAQNSADTSIKQLKRQENELRNEVETLKAAARIATEQMREKQGKMSQLLEELQSLRPKVQGSGYESLLDRISTSIKEKESLIDKPITPLRLRSIESEKDGRGKSATKASLEVRKSPRAAPAELPPDPKPSRISQKAEDFPPPALKPANPSKPSLFSSASEEKPPAIPVVPKPIEEIKAPEVPKKPQLVASKPSLFSAPKLEEAKPTRDYTEDAIPTKETKVEESAVKPVIPEVAKPQPMIELAKNSPSLFESKDPKPFPPPQSDEIGTLDAFPSRRRGKKAVIDPTPAVLPVQSIPPKATDPESADLAQKPRDRTHLLGEEGPAQTESHRPEAAYYESKPAVQSFAPVKPPDTETMDLAAKPRNRSHLVAEEGKSASNPPPLAPLKSSVRDPSPALFDAPAATKPVRDRSHLVEEPAGNSLFASKPVDIDDSKQVKRDRSHLAEAPPSDPVKVDFPQTLAPVGLLDRKKEIQVGGKKDAKTAELAKKAERGGFFGDEAEELDFTDLNQVVKAPPLPARTELKAELPAVKKNEVPKPQVLDLEEEDIML